MAELFLSFASYRPNLIVPPRFLSVPFIIFPSLFHSSINPITGKQFLSNSLEPAFLIFKIFLANSIMAICIAKQIPRKGIFLSLAYLIASIFPSVPLLPNPPGINIPDTFFNFDLISFDLSLSDSILTKLTLTLFEIPPCVRASSSDL